MTFVWSVTCIVSKQSGECDSLTDEFSRHWLIGDYYGESRIQLMILQNRAIAPGRACSSQHVDIGNTKEVENLEETASRMYQKCL